MAKTKKTKIGKNTTIRIKVALYVREWTIEDTLGEDGPYSGYREEDAELTNVIASIGDIPNLGHTSYANTDTFEVFWNPSPGDYVFVLVEKYRDGGTFGSSANFEIKGVYKTAGEADAASQGFKTDHGYFGSHQKWDIRPVVLGRVVS